MSKKRLVITIGILLGGLIVGFVVGWFVKNQLQLLNLYCLRLPVSGHGLKRKLLTMC